MERKDFLQGLGLAGVGAFVAKNGKFTGKAPAAKPFACTLTPSETTGPYPYPGTVPSSYTTSPLYRSNIIGDLPTAGGGGTISGGATAGGGIVLTLTLTLQNLSCTPISGARVDIWHCDKRGYYSGYSSTQNGGNWTAYTFLRGIQTTDSNGQVTFTTIVPGWYIPRATHIHVQIFIDGTLLGTTQLAFPQAVSAAVNASSYYNRTYSYDNSTDQVFSGSTTDLDLEMLTIAGSTAAGYAATRIIAIDYTILPLQLLSFNGGLNNNKINLWWTTTNEENMSHFEIERSENGADYITVGTADAANTAGTHTYSFIDSSVSSGVFYYRLKIADIDGRFKYSTILRINNSDLKKLTVYPNPAKDKLVIMHPKTNATAGILVLNMEGQMLARSTVPADITSTSMDVSFLKAGVYLLVLESLTEKYVIKFSKY
jgi:protocatechuate 3,4-dioxygenase beta subunit